MSTKNLVVFESPPDSFLFQKKKNSVQVIGHDVIDHPDIVNQSFGLSPFNANNLLAIDPNTLTFKTMVVEFIVPL